MSRSVMLVCWLLILAGMARSETMGIGVMRDGSPASIVVTPDVGHYMLFADGHKILEVGSEGMVQLTYDQGKVKVRSFSREMGSYRKVMLLSEHGDNSLRVKSVYPNRAVQTYDDHLEVSVEDLHLRIINKVELENYVAGVIEAEVGYKAHPEFLKVQAILARTYALSHSTRHREDGFDLCDQVHCQVYKHKSRHYNILRAVIETHGMILIDDRLKMVTAAFHSNCGGQTTNSEDVWLTSKPYLRSVIDTFCTSQHHASWEREVNRDDWMHYLQIHKRSAIGAQELDSMACFFPQDERQVLYAGLNIPLKDIRSDWKLKSTYFSVETQGEKVILKGKGYGHGVGLCQEGAMGMADFGKNYKEILFYYYEGINIVSIEALKFFLED